MDDRDIAVSGVVAAPRGTPPSRGRPVIAVGLGTSGLADRCAPSKAPEDLLSSPFVREMLEAGSVVTFTDYEGLGTPGLHPYGVGESAGRSLLDAARAAGHLRRAAAGNRVVLGGHSQAGHAALFAAELAPTYAPRLDVLGAVAIAPLINLINVMRLAPATPAIGHAVMFVKGLEAAYPEAEAGLVLTDQAVADSDIVEQECVDDVLAAFAGRPAQEVFARNPVDVPVWRELLERNSLGPGRIEIPILLVKGDADELLPKPLTDQFVDQLCAAGDPVEYRVYPGATHTSVLQASEADTNAWIPERISGAPASSTC